MIPPRVFVSYSHDSAAHKKWVLKFATTLRNRGIDAILDQWDLKPGDDLPHFMETQLESADFMLMICTKRYVEKANTGEGGVGYEKMIMTSTMLSSIDSSKIIPIIRQNGAQALPTFLKTKLYIDFSEDEEAEYNFDDLLRTLLNTPLFEKPEIGKNPFKPMEEARPNKTSDGVREVMTVVAECFNETSTRYIKFRRMRESTTMHRLTVERYLDKAVEQGLVELDTDDYEYNTWITITPEGREYLVDHNIVA